MIRTKLLSSLVAASFVAIALPSYAASVYINVDPPKRRVEHMEPRAGYVVVPGVWEYRKGKYEWVSGHYVAEQKGYRYESDRWVRHDNNKWIMQRGGWAHDADGDGVPDNKDRRPNDPHRQ